MRQYNTLASEIISIFASFNITHISQNMNTIIDGLSMFTTRPYKFDMANKLDFPVITLYRPHLPNNDESWKFFEEDNTILAFLKDEIHEPSMVINLEHNKYPKGLAPLEDIFSSIHASKVGTYENKFSKTIE